MIFSNWRLFAAFILVPLVLILGGELFGRGTTAWAQSGEADPPEPIVVNDFEDDELGTFPEGWVYVESKDNIRTYEETKGPGREMVVREEAGNRFVRLITRNSHLRYTKRNDVDFDWDLREHPHLEWRWRALHLPKGASEREKNDTGGAVYVTFGEDWLGRPKSIKYTYSSSLSVGTVVSFGPLKVIVIDSAKEPRLGEWKTERQNVYNDYRQVFGEDPPTRPTSITLWSDSDTTEDSARVDVDDIMLRP